MPLDHSANHPANSAAGWPHPDERPGWSPSCPDTPHFPIRPTGHRGRGWPDDTAPLRGGALVPTAVPWGTLGPPPRATVSDLGLRQPPPRAGPAARRTG